MLTIGSFLVTIGAFLLTVEAFCLQWEVPLISTRVDCKQRSSTASKEAATVTEKACPIFLSRSVKFRLEWSTPILKAGPSSNV